MVPTLRLALAQVWVPMVSQSFGFRVKARGDRVSVVVYIVPLELVALMVKKDVPFDT